MKLFGYWRSSASYRVRIALALKGLEYEYVPINLLNGEQREAGYLAVQPQGLVPALVSDTSDSIVQSLAIMEYLEEVAPSPSILPSTPVARGHARSIAAMLACEAQPFMNLRMQKYLRKSFDADDDVVAVWLDQFVGGTMRAVEKMLEHCAGDFCVGDTPTIADCCLVPQMYGAERFNIDLSAMPRLKDIAARARAHPAFEQAHPLNQPDAVKG